MTSRSGQRRGALAVLALIGALLVAIPASAQPESSNGQGQGQPDRYIVTLRDNVQSARSVADEHSRSKGAQVRHVYEHALRGYSARIPDHRVDDVRADPRVLSVVPDTQVSIAAQPVPTGVERIEADQSSTAAGDGTGTVDTAVAVIDTGVDLDHPDLNVQPGKNCTLFGLAGLIQGPEDDNGHGTHVAGTIAAKDDDVGVVGVAPGATVYAVKVLSAAGVGFTSEIICGIDWVTANADSLGITVANMSLGGGGSDDGNCGNTNNDAQHRAICAAVDAGVTFVVAAGNDGANLAESTPAAYDEVLTVTAIADFNGEPGGGAAATCRQDVDDTAADFSNFTTVGSDDVGHTIAFPGTCIESTWLNGGYDTISGTSMASPHAAGAAALCIANGPCAGMTPAQVIDQLRSDAAAQPASYGFVDDPNNPNGDRYYGHLGHVGGY